MKSNGGYSTFVAVGAGGSVVHYHDTREAVQVWDFGDADLRAVDVIHESIPIEAGFLSTGSHFWFVVGEGGTILVGHETLDHEFTWYAQPNIGADLHGVAVTYDGNGALFAVVVGDEFLATSVATSELGMFEWSEQPPPAGGWGQLRHVAAARSGEFRAIGDDGRMWTTDLATPGWVAVDLDTNADLDAGDYFDFLGTASSRFCGTNGSLVNCPEGECSATQVGDFDLVGCGYEWILGLDGRIYGQVPEGFDELDQLGWQPRAADGAMEELIVVGDGGRAGIWARNETIHVGCL